MAPINNPERAPKCSDTQPAIGPPIGVDPRKTTVASARTRPRMEASAWSCTSELAPDTRKTVAAPTGTTATTASARLGRER